MQTPPSQIADALRQLSESDALHELENRLAAQNAFNLFDAIGVSNEELRHSRLFRTFCSAQTNPTVSETLS